MWIVFRGCHSQKACPISIKYHSNWMKNVENRCIISFTLISELWLHRFSWNKQLLSTFACKSAIPQFHCTNLCLVSAYRWTCNDEFKVTYTMYMYQTAECNWEVPWSCRRSSLFWGNFKVLIFVSVNCKFSVLRTYNLMFVGCVSFFLTFVRFSLFSYRNWGFVSHGPVGMVAII